MAITMDSSAQYGIWFNIAAIILCFILIALNKFDKQLPNTQNKLFSILLNEVCALNIVSFLHSFYLINEEVNSSVPEIVDLILVYIEKTLLFMCPFIVFLYTLSVFNIHFGKWRTLFICIIPEAIVIFIIFSSLFTDYFYHFNEIHENEYNYPQAGFIYTGIFVCIFVGIYYGIKYRKFLTKEKYASFWAYVILTLAGIPIRIITKSASIFEFFLVLSLLLCLFTLQSPIESTDMESGLLNINALKFTISSNLAQKKSFYLVQILVPDLSYAELSMASDDSSMLVKLISEFMKGLSKNAEVFRSDVGKFCIYIEGGNLPYLELKGDVEGMIKRFDDPWRLSQEDYILPAKACIIACPRDAKNAEDVLDIFELASKDTKSKDVVDINDLNMMQNALDKRLDEIVKNALNDGSLEVFYQPVYNPLSGTYDCAEALLRLKTTDYGYISPAIFVPVAERNGMIMKIDNFVIDSVCRMLRNSNAVGLGLKYVSINLSTMDLIQSDIVEKLTETMRKFRIPFDKIHVEVRETANEEVSAVINDNIKRLSSQGIGIELDNFGAGYCNLNRLPKTPIDIIKIDKSIVQNALDSEKIYRLLNSVVKISKIMRMEIVAVGVDTGEQAREYIRLGCGHVQGFFYARPMHLEDFILFLEDNN